jgi:hypothetical protein
MWWRLGRSSWEDVSVESTRKSSDLTKDVLKAENEQADCLALESESLTYVATPTKGAPGVDSAAPVTTVINGKTLVEIATAAFGQAPLFWGRYFTSPRARGTVEYRHDVENACLRAAGIRVLPIARQTNHVAGSEAEGQTDGCENAADLVATFGAGYLRSQNVFLFLDVEGAPSLSVAYYRGWTNGLASAEIAILPCVYATQGDTATWKALAEACEAGAACSGLWIAHWGSHAGFVPLPDWSTRKTTPYPPVQAPVLLWQYANNAYGCNGFDCNQTNPAIDVDRDLLPFLVLPPP